MAHDVQGALVDSVVHGHLHLGAGSRVVDSTIIGPVVIGDGVEVVGSVIGPETSVGDGCRISSATIETSIVMERSTVTGWKIRSSIVGRGARLDGAAPASFVEITLGEQSEITGE